MEMRNDRAQNCAECEVARMYCDHEDRTDGMGKVGVGELPKENPMWCPLRERRQSGY